MHSIDPHVIIILYLYKLDIKSSHISLDTFRPATEEDVFKIISKSPKKSCALDPIPAGFLIDILPTLLPTITKIINISLETGTVPRSMKKAIVSPLLKKLTLSFQRFLRK